MDSGPVATVEKPRRPQRRRAAGWFLLCFLATLAAVLGWRTSQIDGLLRPIRVSGPSMSPTLWGPSRAAHCPQCGLRYSVHSTDDIARRTPRCFGCGRLGVEIAEEVQGGDRVLIDRGAYSRRGPQRDDLVAVQTAHGALQVKRVVALPGELLRIDRAGSFVIDGKPLRMSPEQSWQRSVLVYDDDHRGPAGSRWQPSADGQWLVYHHLNVYVPGDPLGGGRADRVRDDDPANITLSRATLPVDDLQLSLRIRSAEPCTLGVVFAVGEAQLSASIDLEAGQSQICITKIGNALWQLRSGHPPHRIGPPHRLAAATSADHGASEPSLDLTRPVAVRAWGSGSPEIDRLWLGRSVRFDPPHQYADCWARGVTVAADRYLVVGDNPPASADSRSAPEGIARDRIVGRVSRWPFQ